MIVTILLLIISVIVSSFGTWVQIQPDKPSFMLAGNATRKYGKVIGWLIYLGGIILLWDILLNKENLDFLVFCLILVGFYFICNTFAYELERMMYMNNKSTLETYIQLFSEYPSLIKEVPSWWRDNAPQWFKDKIRSIIRECAKREGI